MEVDDPDILERLPESLRRRIGDGEGFISHRGGLHVRGACREPAWHSLREACDTFHRHYPELRQDDIPFAEDAVGDQWILRGDQVLRLAAETGDVEPLGLDVDGFFTAVEADPVETLGLHPLLQLEQEGGRLEPGELISVYPPFCMKESGEGVSLRPVSADDCHAFLWDLAEQLRDVPDGGKVRFRFED